MKPTALGCHHLISLPSLFLCLIGSALLISGCEKQSDGLTIAVIPKGATHEHWQRVKAGAERAGKELGVKIIWKAPQTENDRQQQIQLIEQFTADKVSAIVVAPLDENGLVPKVKAATDAKIPVVLIDSGLAGEAGKDFVGYVGTDNRKGGVLAGEALAKALDGKGNVIMLRYMVGSASTNEREAGFLDAIKKHPGIHVVSDKQYAGATSDVAQTKASEMLDDLAKADGVYCPNESSTYGMLVALRKADLLKKIKFVGFDTSKPLLDAIRSGELVAVVAQNPVEMGYKGVQAAVDAIKGKKVAVNTDTGEILVTKENIDSAEVKALFPGQ